MSIYSFGTLIKEVRSRQHISQEELSFGICSVSNLSRIENGLQVPNTVTVELIMERLSLNGYFYIGPSSANELNLLKTQLNVMQDIEARSLRRFREYIRLPDQQLSPYTMQRHKLILAAYNEINRNPNIEDYICALEISLPLDHILIRKKRYFFYTLEIILLQHIARLHALSGDSATAYTLLAMLYDYAKLNNHYLFDVIRHNLGCVHEKKLDDFIFVVAPEQ